MLQGNGVVDTRRELEASGDGQRGRGASRRRLGYEREMVGRETCRAYEMRGHSLVYLDRFQTSGQRTYLWCLPHRLSGDSCSRGQKAIQNAI